VNKTTEENRKLCVKFFSFLFYHSNIFLFPLSRKGRKGERKGKEKRKKGKKKEEKVTPSPLMLLCVTIVGE